MRWGTSTLLLFCLCLIPAYAQEKEKEEVPPGMELLEMGAARVVVPKGTKVRKVGSLVILENNSEYMARKFEEVEGLIAGLKEKAEKLETKDSDLEKTDTNLQANDAELRQEVEKLQQAIAEIKAQIPPAEKQE